MVDAEECELPRRRRGPCNRSGAEGDDTRREPPMPSNETVEPSGAAPSDGRGFQSYF